ncbi:gliding motility-associated C-terminal domain-containing protein, partial [Gaetbulibacter sp. M235]|uniref:gliding motility-associated C-terminal domain-containing protein n=1 Tax=Gaetbulibacter sp. M235 TaxID=3126510 RepID=UPI00374F48E1
AWLNNFTVSGGCAPDGQFAEQYSAPLLCGGSVNIVYNVTDLCENGQDTATFTVNAPTPVAFDQQNLPADTSVECDNVPEAEILTASTSCGNVTVIYNENRTDGNCPSSYELKRTWTATDSCGSMISHTQVITVQDTKAPVAPSAPEDMAYQCIDDVPIAGNLTAVDNCAGDITVAGVDEIDDSNPCNVIIIRTWKFTDNCDNKSSVSQTITVADTTAPELSSNLDTELNVSCSDIPDVPNPTFSDNCSSEVNVVFDEVNTFDENSLTDYQILRTWTITDSCNNESKFIQTLNVSLDEIVTTISAEDRCFDDGVVDLNNYLQSTNSNGTWEMVEGDTTATLEGSIFNPTGLEISPDFLPKDGGIDYLFKYTATENGCISVTNLTMNINADCTVLPCGSEDVKISKAITPNGDQWNEYFEIGLDVLCGFKYDVKIFNRWGALVYESNDYQSNWNGNTGNGAIGSASKVPNGTYYYIVIIKNSDGTVSQGLEPLTGPVYIGTK